MIAAESAIRDTEKEPFIKLEELVKTLMPLGAAYQFQLYEPFFTANPELERIYNDQEEALRQRVRELKKDGKVKNELPDAWIAMSLEALTYVSGIVPTFSGGPRRAPVTKRSSPISKRW